MLTDNYYHRSFIILKSGDKGFNLQEGKEPAGYCKMEIKRNKGKIQLYVQDMAPIEAHKGIYDVVMVSSNNDIEPVKLTSIQVGKEGRGDYEIPFDPRNLQESGQSVEKFHGLSVVYRPLAGNEALKYPLIGYSNKRIELDWKGAITNKLNRLYNRSTHRLSSSALIQEENNDITKVKAHTHNEKAYSQSEKNENISLNEDNDEDNNDDIYNQPITDDGIYNQPVTDEACQLEDTLDVFDIEGANEVKALEVDRNAADQEEDYSLAIEYGLTAQDSLGYDDDLTDFIEAGDVDNDVEYKDYTQEDYLSAELIPDSSNSYPNDSESFEYGFEHMVIPEEDNGEYPGLEGNPYTMNFGNQTYWDRVKDYFIRLFDDHKKVCPFDEVMGEVDWIRVEHRNSFMHNNLYYPKYGYSPRVAHVDHYLVGLVRESGKVQYVIYGIPGIYSSVPPMSMHGFSKWLPVKNGYGAGYWLLYIDAISGNITYP